MPRDSFDDLVESEVRDANRPKPAGPPPGTVGTTSYRNESISSRPRVRLAAPQGSVAAAFFFWLGVADLAATALLAMFVTANAGVVPGVYIAVAGAISAFLWFGISTALDRLDAAAHWTQQTAEAIRQAEESRHQGTASKGD